MIQRIVLNLVLPGLVLVAVPAAVTAADAPATANAAPTAATPATAAPVPPPAAPATPAPTAGVVPQKAPEAPRDSGWKPDTLLAGGQLDHGGYGGVLVRGSRLAGQTGVFVGGRGGWLIDHRITIGGGGMGQTRELDAPAAVQTALNPLFLDFGYGGAFVAYHLWPKQVVHAVVGAMIGGGGVAYTDHDDFGEIESDSVLVVEPELTIEFNVVEFMRLQLSGSYRFVRAVDITALGNSDMSDFAYGGSLVFGKF